MAIVWVVVFVTLFHAFAEQTVRIYLGNGCFWARQYLFVARLEQAALKRQSAEITALAGYAGSTRTGVDSSACYHNAANFSDYDLLGRAEVVQVDVPGEALDDAFSTFFSSFIELSKGIWERPDVFDVGAEYRSLVGIPGGLQNVQAMSALRRANLHNMTLHEGRGSDTDTLGTNSVFIMDSDKFPFIQAELCLQFHDDQVVKYPASYHAVKDVLEKDARIVRTNCPGNYVCNSTAARSASEQLGVSMKAEVPKPIINVSQAPWFDLGSPTIQTGAIVI